MERQYGLVSLSTFFGVTKASVDQKEDRIWGRKSIAEEKSFSND
jgi:hypothetical protein